MISGSVPRFCVIGANHRSASISLRDQLFVDDAQAQAFLSGLKAKGLSQSLVLSTCDRVEVWASYHDTDAAFEMVCQALAERAGLAPKLLVDQLYCLGGQDGVRHAFAVTSSLDSLIIGEPHVLGQVKIAHRLARDAATCGPELDAIMQAAYGIAKRIRTETQVGEGPVSIAAAAVQLARDVHGDLSKATLAVVGAGDMGELIAEHFASHGMGHILVTAPRESRAEALGAALKARVYGFDDLREMLPEADIVVSALGTRQSPLSAELFTAALKKRRRKPMFVVDAAIPGDVEVAVNRLDGAFLYDLGDLERVALASRASREQASRAAWAILDQDLESFLKGRAARVAVPSIVALRERFEETREAVLAEAGDDAAEATRLLINRLLHAPTQSMKNIASDGPDWQPMEKCLRKLFQLD